MRLAALLGLLLAPITLSCAREPAAPLRIGLPPWPAYELLYLAQEKGFFVAEGANVRLIELPTPHDARRAYERGQLDGILGTPVEFLLLRDRPDLSPRACFVLDYSNGGDVILARDAAGVAGLRGRRVGIEPGSPGVLLLARALETARLGLTDVLRVPIDPHRMPAALASGAVDAVVSYPPFSTPIEQAGARRIFSSADVPGEIVDLLILEEGALRARIADAAGLVRAIERAVRWTAEHPDEAHALMARREGVAPADLAHALAYEIELVPLEGQRALLEEGGSIAQTLRRAERSLREAAPLRGPGRDDPGVTTLVVERAARG
jgi:NitT/TauT family transport system substrate-binding protein